MKLLKAGKAITKIMEVFNYIGIALFTVMMVAVFVAPDWVNTGTLTISGMEITRPMENIENPALPMSLIFLSGVGMTAVMALMFHRMHGIIVKAMEGTPFQPCTVKWMRQIGYCSIGIPFIGLVGGIIAQLIPAARDSIHVTLDLTGFVMGLLVLCLTHVFAYGLELQKDVDGLL